MQEGQFEAKGLRKKAQQAVRHRLATETEASDDKVHLSAMNDVIKLLLSVAQTPHPATASACSVTQLL